MNNSNYSLPPLRELPPSRLEQRAEHLYMEITDAHRPRRHMRPFAMLSFRVVRPVLVAATVVLVALALVPIGGASLAQRAMDGVTGLWETPANQPTLDVAAEDAQSIAGPGYFTGAAVNDAGDTVDLYLADAPQSVIEELKAQHPGTYVIHNDAPNTNAALLKLEASFDETRLNAQGIDVTAWGPSVDGYLQVGVTGDVGTAQSALDEIYGRNVVRVYQSQPFTS